MTTVSRNFSVTCKEKIPKQTVARDVATVTFTWGVLDAVKIYACFGILI